MWKWLLVAPFFVFTFYILNAVLKKLSIAHIQDKFLFSFLVFSVFQSSVLALVALPWWSHTLQSPVQQLAITIKDRPETLVQWGVHFPSISTYRQSETPKRDPLPGDLALVRNVNADWPVDAIVIETRGPLSIIQLPAN
jgi:hypothetical protein